MEIITKACTLQDRSITGAHIVERNILQIWFWTCVCASPKSKSKLQHPQKNKLVPLKVCYFRRRLRSLHWSCEDDEKREGLGERGRLPLALWLVPGCETSSLQQGAPEPGSESCPRQQVFDSACVWFRLAFSFAGSGRGWWSKNVPEAQGSLPLQ